MAVSVPREVLERARRNAPPPDQTGPKFGSFGWRMASFQGFAQVLVPTPTPTPTPTPLTTLGPGVLDPETSYYFIEDGGQKINMTAVGSDDVVYLYDNYNGTEVTFTATDVSVNGTLRANISHTIDRIGDSFGFSTTGSTPQAFGTLNGSSINLII